LLDERIQGDALEVRDNRHPHTPGSLSPLLNSNDDQGRFPAFELTASTQTGLRASDPGLVNLYFAPQRLPRCVDHGPPELVEHHPCGLVTGQRQLTLQEQRRNAPFVGGHQVGGPKPGR